MRTFVYLVIFLLFGGSTFAQETTTFGSEEEVCDYTFGFKIVNSFTGETVQCAVLRKPMNGERETYKLLTVDQWAREFTGYSKSAANPKGENFALKYELFDLPSEIKAKGDAEVQTYMVERTKSILGNLWRLKYSSYPFHTDSDWGAGWARNSDASVTFMPSLRQMDVLATYGIDAFNDFFKGENAYRLMKDVRNPQWQKTYRESTDPDYEAPASTEGTEGGE